MQTDDIAAWLTHIWDEDQKAAQFEVDLSEESLRGAEGYTHEWQWVRFTRHPNGGRGSMFAKGAPSPTEVLARIAADREILKRCTDYLDSHFGDDFSGDSLAEDIVRGLALPHAERPGYNEDWRPARLL